MPCITIRFSASSKRSSAYFTVQITRLPILKFPNPSRASLVWYLLYKWNRIGDKQHPCLSPLPVFTLLVSTWSNYTLTPCFMYSLLIILLLCQSVPVSFRMCINLVRLTCSSAFCQSAKQGHSSLFMSTVLSDIILSIPFASVVPFSLLNPTWSCPRTSSINMYVWIICTQIRNEVYWYKITRAKHDFWN